MWRLPWLIFLHRKWRLPRLIFLHWKWRLPWLIFLHGKWRHPNLCNLHQTICSYSGSHHLVSELRLLIQVLSYPIFFFFVICLGSCFCPCSVICVLVLVLVSCVFQTLCKKKNCLSSCFLFFCLSYCILSFLHNFCFNLFEFCLG